MMNENHDPEPEQPEMDHPQFTQENTPVSSETSEWSRPRLDLTKVQVATDRIREELHKVIIGQDTFIDEKSAIVVYRVFFRPFILQSFRIVFSS